MVFGVFGFNHLVPQMYDSVTLCPNADKLDPPIYIKYFIFSFFFIFHFFSFFRFVVLSLRNVGPLDKVMFRTINIGFQINGNA